MIAAFRLQPMTLQSSQAWKSHIQCRCPEFSMLQQLTFVQCSHSGTVHGAPCAHYLIWISWQSLCHLHFAYKETEAIRSSSWIKWSNAGGLIPECTLYPFHHSFLQVHIGSLLLRVFDGAKLLSFFMLVSLSKCVTPHKYKFLHQKNASFIPGDGCPICIAYHMMSITS